MADIACTLLLIPEILQLPVLIQYFNCCLIDQNTANTKFVVMYGTLTSLYQTRHSARTPNIMFPGQFVLLSEVLIGWKSVGTNDRSGRKVPKYFDIKLFYVTAICYSSSRKVWLPGTLSKKKMSESLPGYLPKLKFKYLKIKFFQITEQALLFLWFQKKLLSMTWHEVDLRKKQIMSQQIWNQGGHLGFQFAQ